MKDFSGVYEGRFLDRLAFPLGGLGAGMFCIEGNGALSHFSIQNRPDVWNAPIVFAALSVKRDGKPNVARVLEGPVPAWKPFFPWAHHDSGSGGGMNTFGLPRFDSARFEVRFPFAEIELTDSEVPLEVNVRAWSPFIPGNADDSGLPVGALEYRFENTGRQPIEAVYSFHFRNFLEQKGTAAVTGIPNGFVLRNGPGSEKPETEGALACWTDDPETKVNLSWFRGGWFDSLTMAWKSVADGAMIEQPEQEEERKSPGASLYVPLNLAPGEKKTVRLTLAWRTPYSNVRFNEDVPGTSLEDNYRPWYAEEFKSIEEIVSYWNTHRDRLHAATKVFTDCFYDSTLPPEAIEAVAANLVILKSPTVLRQYDGRFWGWEGSNDQRGSCHGSCTHVWNYAQALPHLFPSLERTLRETEFTVSQDERGHQNFRTNIPISPATHSFHSAADGQLGGLLKLYRDWRICGDLSWLRRLWPYARKSLDYCIEQWDPEHRGVVIEPHHNTYDIEFWGADGMCGSFYVAALHAASEMGRALGENVVAYDALAQAGTDYLNEQLFNGEYYYQKVQMSGLRAENPLEATAIHGKMDYSPEARALLEKEGPKYQYGDGCISDGVLGEFMAWSAGMEPTLDPAKIESHLVSVHKYNLVEDLAKTANPQRPAYAFNHEGGLLLCTWPRGNRLTLPFPYSDEVWTGIEYQVAAHLISFGRVDEGLEIVRACRKRYDGAVRNPFNEMECGLWYARAMSSYALLQALTGVRYDAVEKILYFKPRVKGDFRSFLCTATGFGTAGLRGGKPFFEVKQGEVEIREMKFLSDMP
jgi:uncharacterized protein (DUF608 family)